MACSDQKSQPPAPDPQKIAALDDALKNGLLTQEEYDAKLKALNASGSSTVRPAASTPGKVKISTRMRTVEVQDPVFGIIAFRMQIPEDWKFEGAMLRNPTCGMAAGVVYRASSPDGLVGVQIVPTFIWFWSNNPIYLSTYRQAQCRTMPPMSAADFLPVVASYIRPNPTLGPLEPTVDADQWNAQTEQINQQWQQLNARMHQFGGAVRSRIEYTFHDQLLEENLSVHMQCIQSQIGGMYGGEAQYSWNTFAYVRGFRAPKGQLNSLLPTLVSIFGKGDDYYHTIEWKQRMMQQMADDSARVSAWIKQNGEETMATIKQNFEAFQGQQQARFEHSQAANRETVEATHRCALAYILYAGDQELVRNPGTGQTYAVTNKDGNNAWLDPRGTILMTPDNINPNSWSCARWTPLENVDPLKP